MFVFLLCYFYVVNCSAFWSTAVVNTFDLIIKKYRARVHVFAAYKYIVVVLKLISFSGKILIL